MQESMVEVMVQFCASYLDDNKYICDKETTNINKINRTNTTQTNSILGWCLTEQENHAPGPPTLWKLPSDPSQ